MLETARSHRRIPSVKRTEYLFDFLEVVRSGFSKEAAETKLAERKRIFEIEKTKAVGRGHPFAPALKKASGLVRFCQEMSRHTGLIQKSDGSYELTQKGEYLLNMTSEGRDTDAFVLKSLLDVYPSFSEVIYAIYNSERNEMILPLTTSKAVFSEAAARNSIRVDLWGFAIVRDLCWQLGVLNWFPELIEDGERMQRVFTTCVIREVSQVEANGTITFPIKITVPSGAQATIELNKSDIDQFRNALWKHYLKLTNYFPRRPVFYSSLRSTVCYEVRISDMQFDRLARQMMESDDKYLLIAAGGTLPFSRDSAGMLKSLPPQTTRGEYIVYLKMDERRQ